MKTIIISPYSRKLRGKNTENLKNWPYEYWEELVKLLKENDFKVIQIGVMGEKPITGVDDLVIGLSIKGLKKLISECDNWISVDNFMPHLCSLIGKRKPK